MAETKLGILIEAEDRATATLNNVSNKLKGVSSSFSEAVSASKTFAVGIAAAGAALGGLIGYGTKVAADLQTARIGLTTLLGSADEAGKTVERIKKEAARTPFELVGLTQAVQLLSSVTKNGDKAIDIILDVGEGLAAMGKGQAELDRIIINLQQVAAVGRAQMIDIKQFAFAGIPIFEMLQEQTGLAGEALGDFISEGGVTFELLTQMFDKANDAGGRFFNAYANQAGSFNQATSNLKDSFGIFLSDIVTSTGLFDMMTQAIKSATDFLDKHRESVVNAVNWLKEHHGVLVLVASVITGMLVPAIISATIAIAKMIWTLTFGNPWGMVVAAIILLAYVIISNWDKIKEKTIEIWNAIKDTVGGVIKSISDWVTSLIEKVEKLWSAFNKLNIIQGAKNAAGSVWGGIKNILGVDDAIISPQGKIITTHPDDYIMATKNPALAFAGAGGSTFNFDFSGAYISDIEKLKKVIIDTINRNAELRAYAGK